MDHENIEQYIIGLDFGNYFSQVCCVQNMDPNTRRGGNYLNLMDPSSPNPNGIPSAFFYSSRRNGGKPLMGREAEVARPVSNCVRYMKRNLGNTKTLDGKVFTYDEMITRTIEYIIRQANVQLHKETQHTTNLVSLSYPASFLCSQRAYLVKLVEQATLEDGTHIKVCGTIQEPAAAALDYLAEHPGRTDRSVVLAYDLGAGTFDVSIVEAFPNGQKTASGHTFYYDVHSTDGIAKLGGKEFDEIMYNLIVKKAGFTPTGTHADTIRATAEMSKRELSTAMEVYPDVINPMTGEFCDIVITRQEFEKAARPLVQQTIDMVRSMMNNNPAYKPDLILLTGGASQMPIVKQMMEQAFPEYAGTKDRPSRITPHRPSRAISYGAARYGTLEPDTDVGSRSSNSAPVRQRTTFDIGIRYLHNKDDKNGYIETIIPQGSELPFTSKISESWTLVPTRLSLFSIFEAIRKDPDTEQVARDYRPVFNVTYDHEKVVPVGTQAHTRLILDENNILHIEVRDPATPNRPPLRYEQEFKSLST